VGVVDSCWVSLIDSNETKIIDIMHKGKVIVGSCIVVMALVLLAAVLDATLRDCYSPGERFGRQFSPNELDACDYTLNYYIFSGLSLIMLGSGSWFLIFGLKSLSLVSLRKS